jgi:hypothetical protein
MQRKWHAAVPAAVKRIGSTGFTARFFKRRRDLRLPQGKADIEALRSVTREWLVPRLVEKFLRVHGFELKHTRKFANTANELQPSLPGEGSLMPADAVSKEFRSQAKKKNQYREPM